MAKRSPRQALEDIKVKVHAIERFAAVHIHPLNTAVLAMIGKVEQDERR